MQPSGRDVGSESWDIDSDQPREACGVVGVYAPRESVGELLSGGLHALQHRGQESAGVAVSDGVVITVLKGMGLVTDVLTVRSMSGLDGGIGIGHTRYSTTGSSTLENAQPVFRSVGPVDYALAHNGNLTNTLDLAGQLGQSTHGASTDSDLVGAVVADHMGRVTNPDLVESLQVVLPSIEGAFSLVLMDAEHVVGVRDPHGFRPLCLGHLDNGWALASETAALDVMGARFVREIEPGEMIVIGPSGLESYFPFGVDDINPNLCIFEFVYMARPDSVLYGREVHGARVRMGSLLATKAPVEADMVIGVPDSGIPAAEGFAAESGIPYGHGLVKNRYIGRTFINPTQDARQWAVRRKLNVLREQVRDKRIVVVEDSVVRGTTTEAVSAMLRAAGALEVHLRVALPPVKWPCFYGIDIGSRSELLSAKLSVTQIAHLLNVDSLAYLDVSDLRKAIGVGDGGFCDACMTNDYPTVVNDQISKHALERPAQLPLGVSGVREIRAGTGAEQRTAQRP